MAITYLDILIPSLAGLIGISLGGIINLWARKKALRDEFIFKKKNELYTKLLIIFRKDFELYYAFKSAKTKEKMKMVKDSMKYQKEIRYLQAIQGVYFSKKAEEILNKYVALLGEKEINKILDMEKFLDRLFHLVSTLSRIMKKELKI